MKKLLFMLIVFSSINLDAQWYYRQFGVTNINELNKEQLIFSLDRADRTRRTGMTLTIVGVSAIAGGYVLFIHGLARIGGGIESIGEAAAGGMIAYAGGLIAMAGVPVWIVGKSRKNTINFQLNRFNDSSYIPSIGIRISF
jgi:MFS superfamily sulfate permease-like transporter